MDVLPPLTGPHCHPDAQGEESTPRSFTLNDPLPPIREVERGASQSVPPLPVSGTYSGVSTGEGQGGALSARGTGSQSHR
ncbi:hypothetical protein KIPB_004701, partial [Kipferlia bialata]|eukprot:g4701.t1